MSLFSKEMRSALERVATARHGHDDQPSLPPPCPGTDAAATQFRLVDSAEIRRTLYAIFDNLPVYDQKIEIVENDSERSARSADAEPMAPAGRPAAVAATTVAIASDQRQHN